MSLSELALETLTEGQGRGAETARLEGAVRFYLKDRGAGQAAWPYPGFLRGSEIQADVKVEIDVTEDLWSQFAEEATDQGVTVDQLAEHAAFYFAAEVDAGRVTKRILDELEATEADVAEG